MITINTNMYGFLRLSLYCFKFDWVPKRLIHLAETTIGSVWWRPYRFAGTSPISIPTLYWQRKAQFHFIITWLKRLTIRLICLSNTVYRSMNTPHCATDDLAVMLLIFLFMITQTYFLHWSKYTHLTYFRSKSFQGKI